MENLTVDSLPLAKVLPLFLLALLIYGVAEFAYIHFRQRRAKPGEYGMSLKGMGSTVLAVVLIDFVVGPFSKLLLALWGANFSPFDAGLSPVGWAYGFFIYNIGRRIKSGYCGACTRRITHPNP
jgi:hypothetical protein